MHPHIDKDFRIEVETKTLHISIPLHHMTLDELSELKAQIQELLGKWFICPSISERGAPVFFIKKKESSMRNDDCILIYYRVD